MRLITPRRIPHKKVTNRIDEILSLCSGRRVLHVGCADVPFTKERGEGLLHRKLSKVTNDLWGIDISREGIELLKEMGFSNVYVANAESNLQQEEFDIIVAGEIIEHLGNPAHFLESMKSLMSHKTTLVITTVNAYAFKLFLFAFVGKEKVHEDHNYYFSYYTLKQLVEKSGLVCDELYYYQENNGSFPDKILATVPKLFQPVADGLIAKVRLPSFQ